MTKKRILSKPHTKAYSVLLVSSRVPNGPAKKLIFQNIKVQFYGLVRSRGGPDFWGAGYRTFVGMFLALSELSIWLSFRSGDLISKIRNSGTF
jgi:hypothetical protein